MSLTENLCKSCYKTVKVYVTCFECDALYHVKCLSKVPGLVVKEEGSILCCSEITLKSPDGILKSADNVTTVLSKSHCSEEYITAENVTAVLSKSHCSEEYMKAKKSKENHDVLPDGGLLDKSRIKEENIDGGGTEIGEELSIYYQTSDARYSESSKAKCLGLKNEMDELSSSGGIFVSNFKKEHLCLREQLNTTDGNSPKLKCDEYYLREKWDSQLQNQSSICHDKGQFKCPICDKSYKWKSGLRKHIKCHNIEREKKFTCQYCNVSYHDKISLTYHMNAKHLNDRKYKCSNCLYTAVLKSTLKKHISRVHTVKVRKYKCQHCKYATHEKVHLTNHIHTHTNERLYVCLYEECNYKSTQSRNLKRHMLVKHSDRIMKKYKCEHCEYCTYLKSNLIKHSHIHTKEKPFECSYQGCNYKSTQRQRLKEHMLARHTDEVKKHKCYHCDYSTHHRSNLTAHNRIHLNKKLDKCSQESSS